MIILRIKGGLGNQLLQIMRTLSLNGHLNQKLYIDDITGFIRDKKYRRRSEFKKYFVVPTLSPFLSFPLFFLSKYLSPRFGFTYLKENNVNKYRAEYPNSLVTYVETDVQDINCFFKSGSLHDRCIKYIKNDLLVKSGGSECENLIGMHVRGFETQDPGYDWKPVFKWQIKLLMFLLDSLNNDATVLLHTDLAENVILDRFYAFEPKLTKTLQLKITKSADDFCLMRQYRYFIGSNSTYSLSSRLLAVGGVSYFPPFLVEGIGNWNPFIL